jgi:hypothetical protein
MPGNRPQNRNRFVPFRLRRGSHCFVACSICLSVRNGEEWIEAGEAIRRRRTFEHGDVARLGGALCEGCQTEFRLRRRSASEELAA